MARIVTALVGLVLVAVALGLAIAPVFPLGQFIAPAIADFEARTGTAVRSDATSIELFPTPVVVATGVSIVLPDGLGEVDAERLALSMAPLPFLSGVARLGGVAVDHPTVRLELHQGDLKPLTIVSALTNLAARASAVHFLAVDGTVDIKVGDSGLFIKDLSASAGRSDDGDRLVINARRAGTAYALTVSAKQDGTAAFDLATPAGTLSLAGALAPSALQGHLTATTTDLSSLGVAAINGGGGQLRLEGAVRLDANRADLTDAKTTAFGGNGKLSAALDLAGARPAIDAHAALDRLPADVLTGLVRLAAALDPLGEETPVDIGLDLRVSELGLAGGSARNVHLTTVSRDGRFGAVLDKLAIGNGSLAARVDLVPDGRERRLAASLSIDNLAMRDVVALTGLRTPLSGRLDGGLRLSARGRSAVDFMATMAVDGSATLSDGHLASLKVTNALSTPALTALTAELSIIGLDNPMRLAARATSASGPVKLDAEMLPRHLLNDGSASTTVRVAADRLSATFTGGIDPATMTAEGTLSLSGAPAILMAVGDPTSSASLDAKVEAGPGHIGLSETRLLLGDSTFVGLVDIATGGNRDRLTGRLTGDRIDVAALAGALGSGDPRLAAVDADLRIEAGRIAAGPLAAGGGPVDLRMDGDKAEIGLPGLSLGGGSGSAVLTLSGRDRTGLALKGKLQGARLASLAPILGSGSAIDGQLALDVDLRGEGTSLVRLASTASGTADFTISDGILSSFDPLALLGRLSRSVQTGFGSDDAPVAFDRLSGKLAIDKGVVHTDDLRFAAGSLAVTGKGSLSLADGKADMRFTPVIENYPPFEAPVVLAGTLKAPRLYPDIADLPQKPEAGYARLAGQSGTFARLAHGDAPLRLKAASPDAVATMIDAATAGDAASGPPKAESQPTDRSAGIPPLPLPKPTNLGRAKPTTRPPAAGPLDLTTLGATPAQPVTGQSPCKPGRDGRCIP